MSEQLTAANACSCSPGSGSPRTPVLPTPTGVNLNDGEDVATWLERREQHRAQKINGNGMSVPLSIAVRLLPSPIAVDAKACTHRTDPGGPSLSDEVRLLPTPRASDTGTAGRKAGRGFRPPLSQQVLPLTGTEALLPTPRATDGTKGCPAQRGSKGDLMLPSAVIQLIDVRATAEPPDLS
jgi:DNA (cytosine-5)-methyltransferase 1